MLKKKKLKNEIKKKTKKQKQKKQVVRFVANLQNLTLG